MDSPWNTLWGRHVIEQTCDKTIAPAATKRRQGLFMPLTTHRLSICSRFCGDRLPFLLRGWDDRCPDLSKTVQTKVESLSNTLTITQTGECFRVCTQPCLTRRNYEEIDGYHQRTFGKEREFRASYRLSGHNSG